MVNLYHCEKEVKVPVQQNQGNARLQSSYLEYLPALFRDDEFMGQFLLIFESIMKPIENTVDNIPLYLDPLMTPEPLLPRLASWLDLTLDQTWSEESRRQLVKSAGELYRWRGTKRGLTEYLRIYTGSTPEISEYIPGMRLDQETELGVNTQLGSSGTGHHFTVTIDVDENGKTDINTVKAIIEAQKPAHTVYTLQIRRNGQQRQENGA
jgi:phage tail-like protein